MKAVHLKKITARLDRVNAVFAVDEGRVRRMLFRAVPNIDTRDVSNRANDLIRLLADVPQLINTIIELKNERTELRRVIRELRLQLDNTIVEEDGVEVEREPGVGDVLVALGYLD